MGLDHGPAKGPESVDAWACTYTAGPGTEDVLFDGKFTCVGAGTQEGRTTTFEIDEERTEGDMPAEWKPENAKCTVKVSDDCQDEQVYTDQVSEQIERSFGA